MDRCKKVMIAFGILLSVISAQGASCWAGQPPKPYGKILVSTMIVDALGKIGDPKCVKSIIEVLKSNEFFIKSYAARALGRLGDKEAMPALKNAVVNDKNYLVQITAAGALVMLGDASMEETLLQFLADKNEAARAAAAVTLGEFGVRFARNLLEQLAKETDPIVTAKILEQLDEKPLPSLAKGPVSVRTGIDVRLSAFRVGLGDRDWQIRQASCAGIARFKDKKSIPLLIERLGDESVYVRAAAKEALSELGESALIKFFWQDIDDKDQVLKVSSFIALANLNDVNVVPVLLKEVTSPSVSSLVRIQAARALNMLKPYMLKLVDSSLIMSNLHDVISSDNLEIGYKINGKDLAWIFMDALKNASDPLHNDAPFVLKELNDQAALPALREALSSDDPDMVASCAFILGEIGDKYAVEDMVQVLKKYRF